MRLDIDCLITRVAQRSSVVTRCKQITLLALAAVSLNAAQATAHDVNNAEQSVLVAQAPHVRPYRAPNEIDWDLVNSVYAMICKAGIREPKIVMQQAILETGWFRNKALMGINNVFGFRHVRYLTFDRLEDSVAFYKTWQDERWLPSDPSYFHFLERIRYAVPGYTRHVRNISWNEDCPAAAPPAPIPASRKTTGQSDFPKDPGRL